MTPACLALEPLEARDVPAATLAHGVLTVRGTEMPDTITVDRVGAWGTAYVQVVENGVATDFLLSRVRHVRVFGNGGDDDIALLYGWLDADLYGGDGRDTVYGSHGRDYLKGGPGDDVLHGWGGRDTVAGGAGDDKLYGEDGYDRLAGGPGQDWLNAGSRAEPADGGAGYDFNAHRWAYGGARAADINQQVPRTCVFLSALAGVARTGLIDLARQISYVADDTYLVRLFVDGAWQEVPVTFNGTVTADPSGVYDCLGDREGEFWQLLYQRAYLLTVGYNPYSTDSVAAFPGEWDGNRALTTISGWESQTEAVDANLSPLTLVDLLRDGYALNGIYAEHSYAFAKVFRSGGEWYVRLYNPWGEDTVHDPGLHPRRDGVNDGFMAVSWANFVETFHQYSYA